MNPQAAQYCYRGVIRYLNGDWDLFKHYIAKAKQLYEQEEKENHLWVSIDELLVNKGGWEK